MEQLQEVVRNFARRGPGALDLARYFAGMPAGGEADGEHPFAGPLNPAPPPWCMCGRCWPMPTLRENVCCGERECVTTRGYFRAVTLDYDVLRVAVR
jgi:hypothetical protein